jgi:hypothetical protein
VLPDSLPDGATSKCPDARQAQLPLVEHGASRASEC